MILAWLAFCGALSFTVWLGVPFVGFFTLLLLLLAALEVWRHRAPH
jgi:hypothetical protein